MAKQKTSGWRIFGIITVLLAVIVFYGVAVALFGMTLVRPLWIVTASVIFAVATAIPLSKRWAVLTGTSKGIVNALCHIVAVTGLCMVVILGVNYFARDTNEAVTVRAEVLRVYSETRYRSRRVARNRYTRGEPYRVYYMDVRLPDGRERQRSISMQQYNRYARTGHIRSQRPDSIDLRLTPGALGLTVIERDSK